jgi:hypothetical protein
MVIDVLLVFNVRLGLLGIKVITAIAFAILK